MISGFLHNTLYKAILIFSLLQPIAILYADAQPIDWAKLNEREILEQSIPFYQEQIRTADNAEAYKHIQEILETGKKHNRHGLRAMAYALKANYLSDRFPERKEEAIALYSRALDIAEADRLKILSPYFEYALGEAYYFGPNRIKGIEYLFSAREHVQETGYAHFPVAGPLLYALGTIYCDYNEFQKARHYLLEATRYSFTDSKMLYRLYGMLGLTYYRLQIGDSSIYYSKQALSLAQQMKDTVEVGSMSGNIGAGYIVNKDYDTALKYLYQDYEISTTLKNWASASGSLIAIARVHVSKGDHDVALNLLFRVDSIFGFCKCRTDNAMWEVYKSLTDIYKHKKDYHQTAVFLDSFNRYNEIYISNHNTSVLKGIELKVATEMHETRMKLMESERKRQVLLRNALIIASILVIIIIIQLLFRLRQRQVSERRIFILQLKNAEKQLANYVESLREKNRITESLKEELEQIRFHHTGAQPTDNTEKDKMLTRIREASLITEDGWLEFTKLVDAVHKNFFIHLREKYRDLTPAETRLLTLVKLNFSTNEMADMLGISPDSVKKARQRLRKKIGISSEEDISAVVAQL